jgi:hypothetical protein
MENTPETNKSTSEAGVEQFVKGIEDTTSHISSLKLIEDANKVISEVDIIPEAETFVLGPPFSGSIILNIEKSIKLEVVAIAKNNKENNNNQKGWKPTTITGVVVDMILQSLEKDYNRVPLDRALPVSLQPSLYKTEADKIKQGGVGISKKEKNELLKASRLETYQGDLKAGLITKEEVARLRAEADEKLMDWIDKGIYISSEKTKGASLFDMKREVRKDKAVEDTRHKFYTEQQIVIKVPHFDKLSTKEMVENKRFLNEAGKVNSDKMMIGDGNLSQNIAVLGKMDKEIVDMMGTLSKTHTFLGTHIIQLNKTGKMGSMRKYRFLLFDYVDNKTNEAFFIYTDFLQTISIIDEKNKTNQKKINFEPSKAVIKDEFYK